MNEIDAYMKCLSKLKVGDEVIFYTNEYGDCVFKKTVYTAQAKIVAKDRNDCPVLGVKNKGNFRSFWDKDESGRRFYQTVENFYEYRYCYLAQYGDILIASIVPKK